MFDDLSARSGQVEVMHHVRDCACNLEAKFFSADATGRELFAADRHDFVRRTMQLMDRRVNSRCWYDLSRFVGLWLAIVGKLHDWPAATSLLRYRGTFQLQIRWEAPAPIGCGREFDAPRWTAPRLCLFPMSDAPLRPRGCHRRCQSDNTNSQHAETSRLDSLSQYPGHSAEKQLSLGELASVCSV